MYSIDHMDKFHFPSAASFTCYLNQIPYSHRCIHGVIIFGVFSHSGILFLTCHGSHT